MWVDSWVCPPVLCPPACPPLPFTPREDRPRFRPEGKQTGARSAEGFPIGFHPVPSAMERFNRSGIACCTQRVLPGCLDYCIVRQFPARPIRSRPGVSWRGISICPRCLVCCPPRPDIPMPHRLKYSSSDLLFFKQMIDQSISFFNKDTCLLTGLLTITVFSLNRICTVIDHIWHRI